MAPKSEKDSKSTNKKKTTTKTTQSKPSSKSLKKIEEEEDDMKPLKSSKEPTFSKSTKKITDEDDDDDEMEDDWTKIDEVDSSWDPDFEEFDIPKSKNKTDELAKKRKRKYDEDDAFSIDDDFKDLNNDTLDEEDDLY